MEQSEPIKPRKRIALVAHNSQIDELLGWVTFYRDFLDQYELFTTPETANLLSEKLQLTNTTGFQYMPLDSDQTSLTDVSASPVDFLLFFWVASERIPDDPDIQGLLDMAFAANIPIAANRASADFLFSLLLTSPSSEAGE